MMAFFSALPGYFSPRLKGISLREQFLDSVHAATKPADPTHDLALDTRLLRTRKGGAVELGFAFKQHGFRFTQRDHLIITRLVSQTPGKGHGDEAMTFLKAAADDLGVNLAMFARPIAHKAMPQERLHLWLKTHGFFLQANPHDLYIRDPGGIDPAPAAAP